MSEPDFRKGDKVWVEVVIVDPKYIAPRMMLVHKIDGGNCIWIDKKDVKKHIPTSRPLTVGEQVEFKPAKHYDVIKIHNSGRRYIGQFDPNFFSHREEEDD